MTGPACGHSACRQHFIDTGERACQMDAIRADLARFCDACDALLADEERAAGERCGGVLCDACADERAEANAPSPHHRGWGLRFTDEERDAIEGMED